MHGGHLTQLNSLEELQEVCLKIQPGERMTFEFSEAVSNARFESLTQVIREARCQKDGVEITIRWVGYAHGATISVGCDFLPAQLPKTMPTKKSRFSALMDFFLRRR